MGLQLIAKNDDFSSIGFGRLGPETTIVSGLQGLFALHRDSDLVLTNFAVGGTISPTIVGAPTIDESGVTSNQNNYIDFGFKPIGDRTIAVVFQVGVANAVPISAFSGGGEYLVCKSNTSIAFESTTYSPWLSVSSESSGAEMFAVAIDNNDSVSLYRPKTQTLVAKAPTSNQDKAINYRTSISANNTATTAMLFAYWNRTLTQAELNTFYAEMKEYLGSAGVAVI